MAKKLVRSRDRVIAGVASGVANYFDVDPVLVRTLFIVFGVKGSGIVAYLALWIMMPDEKNFIETVSEA